MPSIKSMVIDLNLDQNHDMDFEFGPNGKDELQKQLEKLTDAGKYGMQDVGKWLREHYVGKLLSPVWNTASSEIVLRSTNYLRTVESLQYLLHGLYPKKDTIGNPKVLVKDTEHETMYPHDACSSMVYDTKLLRDIFAKKHHQRLTSVLNPLSFWHTMHGKKSNENQVYRLYDVFSCMIGNGVQLPEGVTEDDHGKLEGLTIDLWARLYEKDDDFTKRAIGRFIPELFQPMQDMRNKVPNTPRMAIFSGHDSTIIPLLISFRAFDGDYPYPGFGSSLSFEYFEEKMHYPTSKPKGYVQMKYNGEPVTIPACKAPKDHYRNDLSLCTFDAFMQQAKKMSLTEEQYQKMCHSNQKVVPDWD
ncbi:hypothetical protein HK103_004598 [Boothiomyces macroporosus]|uniref:Acid phosphatase n=1 Tax=Boothiomyces macroporosus TaxID=261099 RepID=A0AAD5Y3Y5_9FUNG|nr:hypothetical protein HK103_004598 [Boothiomyces macroporosus]